MESVPMVKGDEFIHIQAGAGGFGDPLEREPEKILIDVQNELITPAYANDVYGVVIIEGEIDLGATEAKRLELKQTGTLEKAYLTHFYDEIGIKPV
jgi:N-methylhydantoinase B